MTAPAMGWGFNRCVQEWLAAEGALAPCLVKATTLQILRVANHVTGEPPPRTGCEEVIAAFQGRGLTPDALVAAFESRLPLAMCFAASAYPNRSFQMATTELAERLEAYRQFVEALSLMPGERVIAERLWCCLATLGRIPLGAAGGDFLRDLVGDAPARKARERYGRLVGALLYIGTLPAARVAHSRTRWQEESTFIRCLRRSIPAPPSVLRETKAGGWDLAQVSRADWDRADILEACARRAFGKWLPKDRVPEVVCEYWDEMWEQLDSGFPYYSFKSRFAAWWKQCLNRYRRPKRRESDGGPAPQAAPDNAEAGQPDSETKTLFAELRLTPEGLRPLREIYRLVRLTFSPQHGTDAKTIEAYRGTIDELWEARLQQRISEDLPPQLVIQIARSRGLAPTLVNNLSHRLRMRIWAASLARFGRLTNSQIRSYQPPGASTNESPPLKNETGILPPACMARIVPTARSLLGAVTAYLAIHPKLAPQRADPWDWPRYLNELWWWVREPGFEERLRADRDQCGVGALAWSLAQQPAMRRVIAALRNDTDGDDPASRLEPREVEAAWQEVYLELRSRLGAGAVDALERTRLLGWRAIAGEHWVVPVWYLAAVERVSCEEIPDRLRIDVDEYDSVAELAEAVVDAVTPDPGASVQRNGT